MPSQFGDVGQFVVLAGSSIGISSSSYSRSSATTFGIGFEPAIEYFAFRNLSIGVEVDLVHSSNKSYEPDGFFASRYTLLGGGVHLGLNLPFAKSFSVYGLLGAGLHHAVQTYELLNAAPNSFSSAGNSASLTATGAWLSLTVPLLYHPVEHFFVGVGPTLYHDFSHASGGWGDGAGVPRTELGARFLLGGYFDLLQQTPEGDAEPDRTKPPKERQRFGDEGTVALTEESGVSWRAVSYSGALSTRNSFDLSGGFDWFFAQDVSLGLAAFYLHHKNVGFPPGPEASEAEALGASVRCGFVVPFYSWFSVYGRMSLDYSMRSVDVVSGASGARTHEHVLAASVSVPAMLHLATHFFVGLGPEVSEDIVHTQQQSGPQNRRTAYGATTLIGGWL